MRARDKRKLRRRRERDTVMLVRARLLGYHEAGIAQWEEQFRRNPWGGREAFAAVLRRLEVDYDQQRGDT